MLSKFYESLDGVTVILISIAIMLLSGFLLTRITKLCKLPNVTGYILAGILIGPSVLGAVPKDIINGMGFISDISIAFIAFGVGRFFKLSHLKKTGKKPIIIALLEAFLPAIPVFLITYFAFGADIRFSLILSAIATATAPASTMVTIKQYHARGVFVDTLLQTIALDNIICLLTFSVAIAIAQVGEGGKITFLGIFLPILFNLSAILVGAGCGYILSKLITPYRSKDNRLILAIAMLLGICGACSILDISPLLSCMALGGVYINITQDKEMFHQIDGFTPPVFSLFFILSGTNLNLSAISAIGLMGVCYFAVRIAGKYLGAFLGCIITKQEKRARNYLGLALIPQAGVAIGLGFLGARLLPAQMGDTLLNVVLASSVLYELVGPACAKLAIFKSGAIDKPKSTAEIQEHEKNAAREALSKIRDKV